MVVSTVILDGDHRATLATNEKWDAIDKQHPIFIEIFSDCFLPVCGN